MPEQALSLDTLGDLDNGSARLIVDRALALAVADLDDRGDDGKPRKVVITVELAKAEGLVVAHVECQAKAPAMRSNGTVGKIKVTGNKSRLLFQPFSPDDPDQSELSGLDDAGR